VYPLLISFQRQTVRIDFFGDLFQPFMFLLFNFCDLIGRSWPYSCFPPHRLWILSVARFGFIPLFLLCNTDSTGALTYVLFESDAWPIIFMALFAFSNGYLCSQFMMYGPLRVGDRVENQMQAGTMMVLFLTLGLFAGSCSSFALFPLNGGGS